MSMVQNKKNLNQMIIDYKNFLSNLDNLVKEVRPRSSIPKTKLQEYLKELENINSLDINEIKKLIGIVTKYNSIASLLKNDNVEFNKSELMKIIEGQFSFDETNDKSNDILFEFVIANRFLSSKKFNEIKIDMLNNCDIIVNNEIAIECKYIHSSSNMMKSIEKAIDQIDTRINDKQAKYGIIALDLTNICQNETFYKNVDFIFNIFMEKNKELKNLYSEDDLLLSVINNNNFQNAIHSYLNHVFESTFRKFFNPLKLNINTKVVIYQSNFSLFFSYNNSTIPIPSRNMTFYLNDNLNEEEKKEMEDLIHSLAVGI